MRLRVKEIIGGVIALLLIGAAVAGYIACRCDNPPPSPSCAAGQIPAGWTVPPELTSPWLPFQHNEASEYTAEFPAGSSVVVLSSQDGGQIEIGILPDGTIVMPEGVNAVVYKKRPAFVGFEARPFVAGGLGVGGMYGAAGVDVLRVWRLHAGPAVAVSYWPGDENPEVGVVGKTSLNVWRNVDLAVMGGYGTAGKMAAGGIEIAIQ